MTARILNWLRAFSLRPSPGDSRNLKGDPDAAPSVEKANLDEIKKRMVMAAENPALWVEGESAMTEISAELVG